MSTAALSAPHLEVTASDTMEIHSDDGLGFGDGDVEIDLDLRSTGGADDDESIRDAGTDAGQDIQNVLGDQDDFMADNEDLIEEDIVDEDVEVDLQPPPAQHTVALEQSQPVDLEEDLIDYSDEEDTALDATPVGGNTYQNSSHDVSAIPGEDTEETISNSPPRTGGYAEQTESGLQQSPDTHQDLDQNDSTLVQESDSHAMQQAGDDLEQPDNHSQPAGHVDPEIPGKTHNSPERRASDPVASSTVTGAENTIEQSEPDVSHANFHPVNVNYHGEDYWLFKHHDYEGSGDYLLEDDSFMKKPLHAVINACREALGAFDVQVASDLELGFRLDSLHHVELYEEHSTCAFFNLDDILGVYMQLHAQDGITDPDYFCVTLLTRPRVSSLLAELSRAATEGIGYSGLNSIIASGQSLFSTHTSHASPENYHELWEETDKQEVSNEQTNFNAGEPADLEEAHGSVHVLHEEEHDDEERQQQSNDENEPVTVGEDYEAETSAAVTASDNDVFGVKNTTASAKDHVEHPNIVTADSEYEPYGQDPQDDLLEYSDDEGDEGKPGVKQIESSEASSASATVQGDEPFETQGQVESGAQDEQHSVYEDETAQDPEIGQSAESVTEYAGKNYPPGEFEEQSYGEAYDEEEYGQEDNEGQEFEDYPSYDAQANDEYTNFSGDLEQRPTDNAGYLDVTAGLDVGDPDAVDDPVERTNDFLDLDDTPAVPQQTVNNDAAEDEIDYSDEEDGAVSHAPVAESVAADTIIASHTEPQNLSAQGQKRGIDELGNDVVDATTSAGMLSRKRLRS